MDGTVGEGKEEAGVEGVGLGRAARVVDGDEEMEHSGGRGFFDLVDPLMAQQQQQQQPQHAEEQRKTRRLN